MAFPFIVAVTQGVQTSDSTTWTLTYPSPLLPDDMVLAICGSDGSVSINSISDTLTYPAKYSWVPTPPNGWDAPSNTACVRGGKKHIVGTETGNFTVTLNAAEQGCWTCVSIRGWAFNRWIPNASNPWPIGVNMVNSDPNGGGCVSNPMATGTDSSAELFSTGIHGASPGEEQLSIMGVIVDGTVTVSSFSNGGTTIGSFQSSGGANGCAMGLMYRQTLGADTAAGEFTLSGAASWGTGWYGIRPNIDPGPGLGQAARAANPTPVKP